MLFLQIWNMTCWMYGKLAEGVTVATAREGDYHYSYFMWFTDYQVLNIIHLKKYMYCQPLIVLRGLDGHGHFNLLQKKALY